MVTSVITTDRYSGVTRFVGAAAGVVAAAGPAGRQRRFARWKKQSRGARGPGRSGRADFEARRGGGRAACAFSGSFGVTTSSL